MNAALWGIASALGWGGADFIARFTGRKLGPDVALLGILLVGMAAMTVAVLVMGLKRAAPRSSRCYSSMTASRAGR